MALRAIIAVRRPPRGKHRSLPQVMGMDAQAAQSAGRTAVNTANMLKDADLFEATRAEYAKYFPDDAEEFFSKLK